MDNKRLQNLYDKYKSMGATEDNIGTYDEFKDYVTDEAKAKRVYKNLVDDGNIDGGKFSESDMLGTLTPLTSDTANVTPNNDTAATPKETQKAEPWEQLYDYDMTAGNMPKSVTPSASLAENMPDVTQPMQQRGATSYVPKDENVSMRVPTSEDVQAYPWLQSAADSQTMVPFLNGNVQVPNAVRQVPAHEWTDADGNPITNEQASTLEKKADMSGDDSIRPKLASAGLWLPEVEITSSKAAVDNTYRQLPHGAVYDSATGERREDLNHLLRTEGQERDLEAAAQKYLVDNPMDKIINESIGTHQDKASQVEEDVLSKIPAVASGLGTMSQWAAAGLANKEQDPDKIAKTVGIKIKDYINGSEFKKALDEQSKIVDIPRDDLRASAIQQLTEGYKDRLESELIKREMPKSDIEYILRGVENSIGGLLASGNMQSAKQKTIRDTATQMYGEKAGTVSRLANMGTGFLMDAPFFGLTGKVSGAAVEKVAARQLQTMMERGMSRSAAQRVIGTTLENSVGRRTADAVMKRVLGGSVNLGMYNAIQDPIQQYATTGTVNPLQTISRTAEGLGTGAILGGVGGAIGGTTAKLSGNAKRLANIGAVLGEAGGFTLGNHIFGGAEADDGKSLSEKYIDNLMQVLVMKAASGENPMKPIAEILNGSAQVQPHSVKFTNGEISEIKSATGAKTLRSALTNELSKQDVKEYLNVVRNKDVSYPTRAKMSWIVSGEKPDTDMPLTKSFDVKSNEDGSVNVVTRDGDGYKNTEHTFLDRSDARDFEIGERQRTKFSEYVDEQQASGYEFGYGTPSDPGTLTPQEASTRLNDLESMLTSCGIKSRKPERLKKMYYDAAADVRDLVGEYLYVKSAMDGIRDRYDEATHAMTEQSFQALDRMTDKSSGNIRPATLQSGEEVYILDGSTPGESGETDAKSSVSVLPKDGGEPRIIEAGEIINYGEETPASVEKALQREQISKAREEQWKKDTHELRPGDKMPYTDESGEQHEGVVTSAYYDGTYDLKLENGKEVRGLGDGVTEQAIGKYKERRQLAPEVYEEDLETPNVETKAESETPKNEESASVEQPLAEPTELPTTEMTAMPMMERDGRQTPDFEKAGKESSIKFLKDNGMSDEDVTAFVVANVKEAQNRVKALSKELKKLLPEGMTPESFRANAQTNKEAAEDSIRQQGEEKKKSLPKPVITADFLKYKEDKAAYDAELLKIDTATEQEISASNKDFDAAISDREKLISDAETRLKAAQKRAEFWDSMAPKVEKKVEAPKVEKKAEEPKDEKKTDEPKVEKKAEEPESSRDVSHPEKKQVEVEDTKDSIVKQIREMPSRTPEEKAAKLKKISDEKAVAVNHFDTAAKKIIKEFGDVSLGDVMGDKARAEVKLSAAESKLKRLKAGGDTSAKSSQGIKACEKEISEMRRIISELAAKEEAIKKRLNEEGYDEGVSRYSELDQIEREMLREQEKESSASEMPAADIAEKKEAEATSVEEKDNVVSKDEKSEAAKKISISEWVALEELIDKGGEAGYKQAVEKYKEIARGSKTYKEESQLFNFMAITASTFNNCLKILKYIPGKVARQVKTEGANPKTAEEKVKAQDLHRGKVARAQLEALEALAAEKGLQVIKDGKGGLEHGDIEYLINDGRIVYVDKREDGVTYYNILNPDGTIEPYTNDRTVKGTVHIRDNRFVEYLNAKEAKPTAKGKTILYSLDPAVDNRGKVARTRAQELFDSIGEKLGMRVQYVEAPSNVNGWVDSKTGTIYLNRRSRRAKEVVMGHEVTHELKKMSPEYYKEFEDCALRLLSSEGKDITKMMDDYRRIYVEHLRGELEKKYVASGVTPSVAKLEASREALATVDDNYVREEMSADVAGRLFGDNYDQVIDDLFKSSDRGIFGKVYEIAKTILDKVKDVFGVGSAEHRMAQKAIKSWEKAYENSVRLGDKTMDASMDMPGADGKSVPTRYSMSAQIEAAGLKHLKEDEHGNVAFVDKDGNLYNHEHLLTPDVVMKSDGSLNYLIDDAIDLGGLPSSRKQGIYNTYTNMLNAYLITGRASNGGFAALTDKWQWIADSVYRTVAANGDDQYMKSLDITRICKKNEAVLNSISELQKRQGFGATPAQVLDIYEQTLKEGYQAPCPVCYVFSRYVPNGQYATVSVYGQRHYADAYVDPRTLSSSERAAREKFWKKELLAREKDNKANASSIKHAKQDLFDIPTIIDNIARQLTAPGNNLSVREQTRLRRQVKLLDNRYRTALNVVAHSQLDGYIKSFVLDKNGHLRDDWRPFPESMALDYRNTAAALREYPGIQRYRNSHGSGAGKSIAYASNNDIGDVALDLGFSQNDLKESVREYTEAEKEAILKEEHGDLNFGTRNLYYWAARERDPKKKKELLTAAKTRLQKSLTYLAQQRLRGGQRMWSWSDNIERLAPDVYVNLMQLEILNGALQSYSKQLEAVKMVAAMDGYVNGSLMGKGCGYREVPISDIIDADGNYYLKEGYKTQDESGRFTDHKIPVFKMGDKFLTLDFDPIVGIQAYGEFDKDGNYKKGLFDLNESYDRAGNIVVGMDDNHVRLCMLDDRIFFVIPYHRSGGNNHILTQMYKMLGIDYNTKGYLIDYTDMQEEKSFGTAKAGKSIPQNVIEFWESHYNTKQRYGDYLIAGNEFRCGIEGGVKSDGAGHLTDSQKHYIELRNAIFKGVAKLDGRLAAGRDQKETGGIIRVEEGNPEWYAEIQRDEFLSQVLKKVRESVGENGFMTTGDSKYIYPYEYWDETTTVKTADINSARYVEYCRRLGVKPKFTGTTMNEATDKGYFVHDKGYWKLLIDRRMYGTKGQYQWLTSVKTSGFKSSMADPEETSKEFNTTQVADAEGVNVIVDKVLQRESERYGGELQVDYDGTLTAAAKEYEKAHAAAPFYDIKGNIYKNNPETNKEPKLKFSLETEKKSKPSLKVEKPDAALQAVEAAGVVKSGKWRSDVSRKVYEANRILLSAIAKDPKLSKDEKANRIEKLFADGERDERTAIANEERKIEKAEENNNSETKYSLRVGPAPKKTRKAVKMFKVDKDGNPHALFIDSATPIPVKAWVNADSPKLDDLKELPEGIYFVDKSGTAHPYTGKGKKPNKTELDKAAAENGRYMLISHYADGEKKFENFGINGSGTVSTFALRPGLHITNAPSARHIGANAEDGKTKAWRRPDERWFEVEYAADNDYNAEAEASTSKAKGIDAHIPSDGWYEFQTNSNANPNQTWIISGAMRILRPLNEAQAARMSRRKGIKEDLPYKDGIKNFDEESATTPKKQFLKENHMDEKTLDELAVAGVVYESAGELFDWSAAARKRYDENKLLVTAIVKDRKMDLDEKTNRLQKIFEGTDGAPDGGGNGKVGRESLTTISEMSREQRAAQADERLLDAFDTGTRYSLESAEPKRRKGESEDAYKRRLRDYYKDQLHYPAPDNTEIRAKWDAQYERDMREWEQNTGVSRNAQIPHKADDESIQAFAVRLADYQQARAGEPDYFKYLDEADKEYKAKYEEWKLSNDTYDEDHDSILLYEGRGREESSDSEHYDNLYADAMIDRKFAADNGVAVDDAGARRRAKISVIERRKDIESASAEDSIFIHDLCKQSNAIGKTVGMDGKEVRETLPFLIEEHRRARDLVRELQGIDYADDNKQTPKMNYLPIGIDDLIKTVRERTSLAHAWGNYVAARDTSDSVSAERAVRAECQKVADAINALGGDRRPLETDDILSEAGVLSKNIIPPYYVDMVEKLRGNKDVEKMLSDIETWYNNFFGYIEDAGLRGDAGCLEGEYVNHMWDKQSSDPVAWKRYVENRQRLRSSNMRHREVSTYVEGMELGLVPKTMDIADMLAWYSRSNIEAVCNKRFLDNMMYINVTEPVDGNDKEPLIYPMVTTEQPLAFVRDKYSEPYYVPGVGDVWVYAPVKSRFAAVFGPLRTQGVSQWMTDAAHGMDTVASTMKKIQLSISGFHMGALSEVALAQMGPVKGTVAVFKALCSNLSKYHDEPAFANPEDFKSAASHLVQLGATQDYSASDVNAITTKFKEHLESFSKSHPNLGTESAVLLGEALDWANKGFDKVLWNYLHDGLKIQCFKMFKEQIEARVEQEGLDDDTKERLLDEAGQYVNDTFGGQYWELLNISPAAVKWMRRALLSPDWLVSTQRHFLANFGFGSLYSDSSWHNYLKFNTDNLKRLFGADIARDEYRRFRSSNAKKCYILGVGFFFYPLMNMLNAWFRRKDEDAEKAKADEIRKHDPGYKSPYEIAYPDGMKWYDYTMAGNVMGQQTHLFMGRYKDGTEQYVRWGKQFRELPEMFIGRKGVDFPTPMIERMMGKSNPIIGTVKDLMGSLGVWGFSTDKQTQEIIAKHGNKIAALATTAKHFLPFSVPTQEDKEFKVIDLFMPSQKGFSKGKTLSYFKDFIKAGDMTGIEKTIQAAMMSGIDPEPLLNLAEQEVEATQKQHLKSGVEDLQGAMNKFDSSHDSKERSVYAKMIKQYQLQELNPREYDDVHAIMERYLAPDDEDSSPKTSEKLMMNSSSQDLVIANKQSALSRQAKKMWDRAKDNEQLQEHYSSWLTIYKVLSQSNRSCNKLAKDLTDDPTSMTNLSIMEEIREVRRQAEEEISTLPQPK